MDQHKPFNRGGVMVRVQCSKCGKLVANETGVDVVVRAFVECPECIEKVNFEIEKLTQIMRYVASNTRDSWARGYLVGRLDDRGHDSTLSDPIVVDADKEELQIEVERLPKTDRSEAVRSSTSKPA